MKTLTAAALAEIAKPFGVEPITIVEIEWEVGSVSRYADKSIQGIDGKILTVSPINTVMNLGNAESVEATISLDDTDGSIKAILDTVDVHKKTAVLYQYYGGLSDLDDKFVIFSGKISTPFSWGENDREIEFTIINQIESYEVGFSPEEGQLDFVSEDFIGVPWPLVFGSCVHVPAQKVKQVGQAKLLDVLARHDPSLDWKIQRIEEAYQWEQFLFKFWELVDVGATSLAPAAQLILDTLVILIVQLNAKLNEIVARQVLLDKAKLDAQKNPKNVFFRNNLRVHQQAIENLGKQAGILKLQKDSIEEQVKLLEFEIELRNRAAKEQVTAYNAMRSLYVKYLDAHKELCEQKRFERTTLRVQEAERAGFPDLTPTDVVIRGVRMRVQFDHSDGTMDILELPIDRYQNLAVQTWASDDEPCSGITDIDGIDMFRLSAASPPNLEGMYLLLKKRGTDDTDGCKDRHIVKVRKQVGQKVYFDLVPYDSGGTGRNRGTNVDDIVRGITSSTFVPGPLGNPIPSSFFTGDFDQSVWVTQEGQAVLDILALTGPVDKDDLENIAKLVTLRPKDEALTGLVIVAPTKREVYTIIGEDVDEVVAASGIIPDSWFNDYCIPYEEVPNNMFWSANSGSSIIPAGPDCEIYIANILPSTIHAVHAYRTNEDGERYLAPVPSRYYIKNLSANLGMYDVTALTFPRALTSIAGENWESEVYVTLTSSIGPNVVDIIEWLIDTYTDKSADASNFAAVKAKFKSGSDELYPAHFAIFERPNVLQEIQRIAWEARCAIYLRNDKFYLKYLAEEPVSDDTITESSIETKSLVVNYTATEDLVTRLIATYDRNYLPLEPGQKQPKYVLRHNVAKYGLQSTVEHFHIYNIPELVLKSATFWLIRRSNTWKKVAFNTFHTKIRLDALDTLTLNLASSFFSDSAIKTVLESVTYDSGSNSISIQAHTGIRTGEMSQYPYFWPAASTDEFPTLGEISLGYAGGYGPGQGVMGTIDDCPPEP